MLFLLHGKEDQRGERRKSKTAAGTTERYGSAMAYEKASTLTVSGPFNVQHIPKVRNIAQPAFSVPSGSSEAVTVAGEDMKTSSSSSSSASSGARTTFTTIAASGGSTPVSSSCGMVGPSHFTRRKGAGAGAFTTSAIIVCTLGFLAEYGNELTCAPGDIFKLVDPTITNGWVLVQSLSTGRKGWVPKDNVKILDLHNSNGNGPIRNMTSAGERKRVQKEEEGGKREKLVTPSMSPSSSCLSSNSILDFYSTQMTPCTSSLSSSHVSPLSTKNTSIRPENHLTHTYASIFAHSMYFLESSSSASYWYRIDLVSAQNSSQKIHLCRYYTDILVLARYLSSQADSLTAGTVLPKLPDAFCLGEDSARAEGDDSFASHISQIDEYLQQLFNVIQAQPEDAPPVLTFLKFCQPADNDFEHYVPLDDDQILRILKPHQGEVSNDIELILKDEEKEEGVDEHGKLRNHHPGNSNNAVNNELGDFLFTAPKLRKTFSATSLSSRNSSSTTISSPSTMGSAIYVKIKIIYKDEYSLIKLPGDELTFENLSTAISDKLKGLCRFTMAYRNDNGIFILLRDDNGLKKALLINNRKIIVKVI